MTERALVTGGAGFIGSHLVDRLLDEGLEVTALDNFSTGTPRNLEHRRSDRRLRVVEGTVMDAKTVDALVREHGLVFHLAAAVGVGHIMRDPLGSILTNVTGTDHVLSSAHRHGVRVLVASSSEVYGRSERIPFREDGERVLGPTWVHRWSYATAKAIDEHLAFAYAVRGLRMSIVRYFNAYGPRIDEGGYGSVVARFASQALRGEPITVHGDGLQTRCFTYVTDTVLGTILAARHEEAIGQVFNIGNPREVSILQLAELVRGLLGSRSPIALVPYESHFGQGFQDTRRRVPDVTNAHQKLGFRAAVPLEQGLASTLAWCREHYQRST